jgi:hypothetical protein
MSVLPQRREACTELLTLLQRTGFQDVGICMQLHGLCAMGGRVHPREHHGQDVGTMRERFEVLLYRLAIDARQGEIEQDQVRIGRVFLDRQGVKEVQRGLAIA